MRISDWSSDVCSSDLVAVDPQRHVGDRADLQGDTALDDAVEEGRILYDAYAVAQAARVQVVQAGPDVGSPDQLAAVRHHQQASPLGDPEGRREVRGGAARSEEHTSELQSLMRISYAVFCLNKKTTDK